MSQDPLRSPIERYLQHGDVRPSPQKLDSYVVQFEARQGLPSAVVAADVRIDLAMARPRAASRHLDAAERGLTGVIEQVDYLYESGYEIEAEKESELAVTAHLRRAELPVWHAAATRQPLRSQYSRALEAAVAANHLAHNSTAVAKLVEFLPVLLVARADDRGQGGGLVGRLSLAREDSRRFIAAGQNPNWDCGFAPSDQPAQFGSPDVKMQVKTARQRSAYKPGIIVFKAANYGLDNVDQILESCADEAGLEMHYDVSLLSSQELDDRTSKIQRRIANELAAPRLAY